MRNTHEMTKLIHPRLDPIIAVTGGLQLAARELVRQAQASRPTPRRKRGETLRPGPGTPMWSALVEAIRPYLAKRGERARLARLLGLDAARIHEYFVKNSAMPDAERTLLLIQWLALRRAGRPPG